MKLLKRQRLFILLFMVIAAACAKEDVIKLPGFIDARYVDIASAAAGHLNQLAVYRGDLVKEGDLLFKLDHLPESALLAQAKSEQRTARETLQNLIKGRRTIVIAAVQARLDQAKASLALSTLTLDRNRKLLKSLSVSQSSVDQALAIYKRDLQRVKELTANLKEAKLDARESLIAAQKARIDSAEANVERLTWELKQKTVYAPRKARVFDTFFEAGEYIPKGQPVLSLLAPEEIRVIFYVPEIWLKLIRMGQSIQFNCDSCQKKYTAKITYISPQAEYTPPVIFSKDTRSKLVYRVEASLEIQLAKQFHPGQPVDVFLTRKKNQLKQGET